MVVASAETHGRPHTEDLLAGLEVIPAAKVPYQGALAEEMDLGAVLARGPAVALVDDFAHYNAPGSRHRARWQDVEDLLAAGIDVISTVRVGHLDSLADVVAKITGTAPRQTVPDPVVRAAGEVELVDVAPEALRDRLARGHIYPADQVGGGAGRLVPDGEPVGAARACPAVAGRRAGRRPAAAPSRWRRSRQRSGPGAGGGRAQRWPGGRDADPPGGPDRRPVRRGPAGGARRPAWPPGQLGPCRARRPAPAGRVGRRHLPPARRPGHPGGAAGLRPRAQRHPAGAWRHPPHLAGRAAARSQHQIAGYPPRRRTRRAHRHLHTHRQQRPGHGV